ncbi:hypothetical protein ACU8C9_001662 [Campylobacter jejuni]|uniref:hypothetical protein n=1 Tax=Campylobacter jejuni TaxID=197 RepID=UPI000258144F|nr:hypothetical protein [Campylobacter jejuni]EDJ1537278.1 hypothetical protein [Campylobacter jejuni]EDJ1538898.1 hypothetical protein [Campylobacter jejuni]EDJ6123392.1 hypothetical protein [Campylobacter jejuni]EDN2820293.1 hypothetical protein [Campylobacter jejuni]EIB43519.1 hypothetical protein cje135_02713 [Campylobacter jejuni subsp. jejuni ATCC 33560]
MLTEKIDPKEQIQKEDIKKSKTLKEVFKEWVENFYKEKSNYNTPHRVDIHIISKLGDKDITTLTRQDIIAIYDKLQAEGKLETIKRFLKPLKELYCMP